MSRSPLLHLFFCVSLVGGCGGGTASPDDAATDAATPSDGGGLDVGARDAATACTAPADCDDANPCTTDACASGLCAHTSADVVCRPAAGACDVEERCVASACPADAFAPATTTCRAAMDVCDPAETCSGTAAACPADDPTATLDCDDHDQCTADACDATTGCGSMLTAAYGHAVPSGELAGAILALPMAATSGSSGGAFTYDVCPGGAMPPACVVEVDFASVGLSVTHDDATTLELAAAIPVRARDIPIDLRIVGTPGHVDATVTGNDACPGTAQTPALIAMTLTIQRSGLPTMSVAMSLDEAGLPIQFCGAVSGTAVAAIRAAVQSDVVSTILTGVVASVEDQLCLHATPGPCPAGSSDHAGLCRPDAAPTSCIVRTESTGAILHAAACVE